MGTKSSENHQSITEESRVSFIMVFGPVSRTVTLRSLLFVSPTLEERVKAHLTRVSLALLPMVFLLSCQDSGTGPVGPDGLVPQFHAAHVDTCEGHDKKDNPNCGGGGGGEPTEPDATVVLSGG